MQLPRFIARNLVIKSHCSEGSLGPWTCPSFLAVTESNDSGGLFVDRSCQPAAMFREYEDGEGGDSTSDRSGHGIFPQIRREFPVRERESRDHKATDTGCKEEPVNKIMRGSASRRILHHRACKIEIPTFREHGMPSQTFLAHRA